jgi:hypothetical protein
VFSRFTDRYLPWEKTVVANVNVQNRLKKKVNFIIRKSFLYPNGEKKWVESGFFFINLHVLRFEKCQFP